MRITVPLPASLVRDGSLPASAKVLWACLSLELPPTGGPVVLTRVAERCGVHVGTVRNGLSRLKQEGFLLPRTPSRGSTGPWQVSPIFDATANLPVALLDDRLVEVTSKLLYAALQLTPDFHRARGECTYPVMAKCAALAPKTVRRALRSLAENRWVTFEQSGKRGPIRFSLENPVLDEQRARLQMVQSRLQKAPYLGEALMREYLTLLVARNDYEDDASPAFLTNLQTGEKLQYDRFYPPDVAFEFNGPQHYGPTERYPDEHDAAMQRWRDFQKLGISQAHGITLVVVHAQDLSLETMKSKTEGLLPMRDLAGYELVIPYLESISRRYRRKAARAADNR